MFYDYVNNIWNDASHIGDRRWSDRWSMDCTPSTKETMEWETSTQKTNNDMTMQLIGCSSWRITGNEDKFLDFKETAIKGYRNQDYRKYEH